jgi:hypothetical protein
MNFKNQGHPLSSAGIENICTTLGVKQAEVWSVMSVETKGFGFLSDRRPQILFERHIFHKQTNGVYDAQYPDISSAQPGGYVGGVGEYPRLEKAMNLNQTAAFLSTSWGIGQVMGFNFKAAGYTDVNTMVNDMVTNEDAQLLAMANFIKGNKLDKALQNNDWAAFAFGYNGKDYKKNKYDEKLKDAHTRYVNHLPDLRIRTAQAALQYLAYNPGSVDGLIGKITTAAILQFQKDTGLPGTGTLDSETENRLLEKAFPA